MKIVGLTGGIGSGKTTVAIFFKALGVPIYIADVEAKKLMVKNTKLKNKITALFGLDSYQNGELNRKYIANLVFKDPEKLKDLNNLVHPAVAEDFKQWVSAQNAVYVVKESALLFETGDYKNCDVVILVKAPLDERVKRVIKRDNTSRELVMERIYQQWPDEKKESLSDYIIENSDILLTKNLVSNINVKLLNII
ncbi:MAG: dephospho-CoA kinase [Flavobacteriales bacterium CG_4_9_14_3_um_filter_40_17]|nr:MAG: dephospho-CoA kinase [Flavobacteriales bacterium CG_4_9_14_3_um_filter_40_17]